MDASTYRAGRAKIISEFFGNFYDALRGKTTRAKWLPTQKKV
jgi:hypothetical protein